LVETRKRILSKTKLALGPMTILASLTRRQRSSINAPLRAAPSTPLLLAALEVCLELYEKVLTTPTTLYMGVREVLGGFLGCGVDFY
jgi:hypothetical protein